jgi:hypothetical protein
MRRRFKPIDPLDKRLAEEAQCLRKEAQGTPPGVERERLLRRARQAEAAAHRFSKPSCPPSVPHLAEFFIRRWIPTTGHDKMSLVIQSGSLNQALREQHEAVSTLLTDNPVSILT